MCGIFAYLNYDVSRERRYILEVLFNGLHRLQYRGYDSAGISIDSSAVIGAVHASSDSPLVFRQEGKIESLVRSVYEVNQNDEGQMLSSPGQHPQDFGNSSSPAQCPLSVRLMLYKDFQFSVAIHSKNSMSTSTVSGKENPALRQRSAVSGKKEISSKYPPDSVTHSNRPCWKIFFGILTKNCVLFLVLFLLYEMILRLKFGSKGIHSLGSDWRIDAIAESLLQKTTKTIQVEVEVVDRQLGREIRDVRNQLGTKIDGNDVHFRINLRRLYERVESVEKSLTSGEYIGKDELNKLLEKSVFKKRTNEGFDVDMKLAEVKAFVEEILEREIEKHAADGMGMIDYAVASGGGVVVKHSEPYNLKDQKRFKEDEIHVDAQKILQPSFGEPGQCFALKGSSGYAQIKLKKAIIPKSITLEHVAKSVAYDRSSAPKDCRVVGWFHNSTVDAHKTFILTHFSYDLEKSNVQTHTVSENKYSYVHPVNMISLEFISNHGNPTYTCIYRLRVHGHELDSLPRDGLVLWASV